MIEQIPDLPGNVLGFEAKGEVTGDDYEQVLVPAIEQGLEANDKVRLLYVLGNEFDGYSAGAMWDDAKVGMHHPFSFERIALVTDNDLYGRATKGFGFLMPAQVKVFAVAELDDAKAFVTG
ncbi:MAG: STAS/SEC14 domain-containing protein [Solirubrobacterales bacterium]